MSPPSTPAGGDDAGPGSAVEDDPDAGSATGGAPEVEPGPDGTAGAGSGSVAATGRDRVVLAVAALVLAGLVARLVGLGARPAHFDEARVAYWVWNYHLTGEVHYRYIIHGPLVQHVVRPLFALFGPSDLVARLPIALVGAALPAVALLFRDDGRDAAIDGGGTGDATDGDGTGDGSPRHAGTPGRRLDGLVRLSDVETVALAAFLAVNPILLYYSRFFRSTLPVAAFALVTFACLVRLVQDRRPRYLYGAAVALALAFGAKENAAVYVLCWLGAGVLLVDYGLHRPRGYDSGLDRLGALGARLRRVPGEVGAAWAGRGVLAVLAFLAVGLFVYAPRDPGGVGFWSTLTAPWQLPELVSATVDDVATGYGYWFGGSTEPGCRKDNLIAGYVCFLRSFLDATFQYAAPLLALSVLGFLHERYVRPAPRGFVVAAGYWGFVSVLGYPLGTDVWGAWIVANAIVALAIPAAVGAGVVVRFVLDALADRDLASASLAVAVVLAGAGWSGVAVVDDVYGDPTAADNDLVQYAQPSGELRAVTDRVRQTAERTGSTTGGAATGGSADDDAVDVLVYGSEFVDGDETAPRRPACVKWFELLPVPWYLNASGAETACVVDEAGLDRFEEAGYPPIVLARANHEATLAPRLAGYERTTVRLRTTARPVVIFYDPARAGSGEADGSTAVDDPASIRIDGT
jgi:uncharacterized protein (TIGR03663 family)